MNVITPLNPDVQPDALPESPKPDASTQSNDAVTAPLDYVDYNIPAVEVEQPSVQPASYASMPPKPPTTQAAFGVGAVPTKSAAVIASSSFLMKYIASLFAGVNVLYGLAVFGFILLDHFINKPAGAKVGNVFDASTLVSTWHVWLVASLLTFAVLYLTLSRSVGKYIVEDNASEREIQVAEVARSIFTAILVISAASLVASLLFTLLNGTLAAAEIEGKDIAIQVVGSILAFIWIGLIIWHQTSIHVRGKNGVAGISLAAGALIIAVLASVFLLAAGRNAVIDSRTTSDLSTIQSELSSYKFKNDTYPDKLSLLTIDDEKTKSRIGKYTYTRTETAKQSSFQVGDEDMFSSDSMYDSPSSFSRSSSLPESGYKLCATFLTDASKTSTLYDGTMTDSDGSSSTFSSHGKGEHCVERKQ